jgi:serine/threonine-protein kinase
MGDPWFGHYRLDRLLGNGGTGQVWLAHDTVADRDVALKVLAAPLAADATYRRRFTREARLAAQVPGPHIVPIHTFGELEGRLYIDMKFIEGTDVAALLSRDGPMPPMRAVRIIAQTAMALDAAHRAGLVHRDVKPSNIMVGTDGFVHLIDFGIAHRLDQPALTANDNIVGTLAYMAPERFEGSADGRADQYSLACVLYECLTGQRPFGNIDSAQQLRAHLLVEPPRASVYPAVPAALDPVIARGLAKRPGQRWSSAGELASAAFVAVTGRDATTVEIAAATRQLIYHDRTRVHSEATGRASRSSPVENDRSNAADPSQVAPALQAGLASSELAVRRVERSSGGAESARRIGPVLAVAAISSLVVLTGVALWLGRPGGAETGAAGPPSTTVVPAVPGSTPRSPVSVESAPAVLPVAGQPCDPDVDGSVLGEDGTPLACQATGGRFAQWVPAQPVADSSKPDSDQPVPGNSVGDNGNDNSGNGDSGNGNGHGNGKPGKVKPAKPGK